VRIVFCGGCNPVIDRVTLADELKSDPELAGVDVEIDLSGCSRSCAAGRALASERPDVVVVAGRHVDGRPLDERELAGRVRDALRAMTTSPKE
jgi:hypothetical protein